MVVLSVLFFFKVLTMFSFWPINMGLISLIIGVLSLLLSFYFFFKSKKSKKPVYRCRTARVIQRNVVNQIDDLEVFYDNQKLPALTITKLAIWNEGRDTISDTDLSNSDKLRIEIDKQYDILSCEVLIQSKPANNFSLQISGDQKSVFLSFAYLDYNDGAVLKIRHTGAESADLEIMGSIKTVKEIQRKFGAGAGGAIQKFGRLYVYVMLGSTFALTVLVFWFSISHIIEYFSTGSGNIWLNLFLFAMGVIYSSLLVKLLRRPAPRPLMNVFISEDF